MAITFANALGIHEHALQLRGMRSEILANNIANSDTPGFKARDMDFVSILQGKMRAQQTTMKMVTSDSRHLSGSAGFVADDVLMYRIPLQASVDGNTVDEQIENAAFARNALQHQASFQFLNGRFTGMIKALRGE